MNILAGLVVQYSGSSFAYTVERLDVWVLKFSIAIPLVLIATLIVFNLARSFARKLFAKPRTIKKDPPSRSAIPHSSLHAEPADVTSASREQAITAHPPPAASRGLDADRRRQAHEWLAEAKEDFRQRRFPSCLDRCEKLAVHFSDLLEGNQAKDLADHIKDNAEFMDRACTDQANSLANRYLELADSWSRKGQKQKSIAVLQKLARCFPDTDQSRLALDRLRNLSSHPPEDGAQTDSLSAQ